MSAPDASNADPLEYFRVCSICRKPIQFGVGYYRCSVSTCNRPRLALFFCSVACWDAHVPEARHRDAWAEEARAPSREAFRAEQLAEQAERQPKQKEPMVDDKTPRDRKIVAPSNTSEGAGEVLIVVSKLKAYIRARSGFNTSDAVTEVLSDHLRRLCDLAIENATSDSRKTVLDRDFKPLIKP